MSEIKRIEDQMQRAFDGEAWHGPPLMQILRGLSTAAAAARPIANAHSAWEIVLHMTATQEMVVRRFDGEPAQNAGDVDWPPVAEVSDAAWRDAVERLSRSHEAILAVLARLDDAALDEPVLPGFSSAYVTLHGLVQHSLYHAGQIAILRKAL